jgi:branched-chain amino acid transport system substrate-binding protein
MSKRASILLLSLILVFSLICLSYAAETIKIGAHVPLTGWAAADGLSARRGMELAVKFINDAGGIDGKLLQLILYDEKSEAKEAVLAARKLIERNKVVVAISGSYSTPTRAAAPLFNAAKIPYISVIGTHPEIPLNRKYVFQVAIMSELHGRVGAKVAADKLNAKSASLLVMDNDFGIAVTAGFKEYAPKLGINIISEYKYPLGENDFRSLLNNIKKDNPDVLWASGYYHEAAQIAKQAKEIGLKTTIIGQEGFDSPMLFELGGKETDGILITTSLDRDSDNPLTRKFLEDYKNAYGVEADMIAAGAFDAVELFAFAIKQSGTDADAIVETISNLKNYENAVSGPFIRFDEEGRVIRVLVVEEARDLEFHRFYVVDEPEYITP